MGRLKTRTHLIPFDFFWSMDIEEIDNNPGEEKEERSSSTGTPTKILMGGPLTPTNNSKVKCKKNQRAHSKF